MVNYGIIVLSSLLIFMAFKDTSENKEINNNIIYRYFKDALVAVVIALIISVLVKYISFATAIVSLALAIVAIAITTFSVKDIKITATSFINLALKRSNEFMMIAVTFFVLMAGLYLVVRIADFLFHFIPLERISHSVDSQDALQITALLAVFGSFLAYVFRVIVQKTIWDESRRISDESRHFSEAHSFKVGGLSKYYAFLAKASYEIKSNNSTSETTRNDKKNPIGIEKDSLLKGAIEITEKALEIASRLDNKTAKNDILILTCKNNLAWYLAERGNADDKDRALALAVSCCQKNKDYYDLAKDFSSTLEFVNDIYKKKTL